MSFTVTLCGIPDASGRIATDSMLVGPEHAVRRTGPALRMGRLQGLLRGTAGRNVEIYASMQRCRVEARRASVGMLRARFVDDLSSRNPMDGKPRGGGMTNRTRRCCTGTVAARSWSSAAGTVEAATPHHLRPKRERQV